MIRSIRLRTLAFALAVIAILSPALSSGDPGERSPSSKAKATPNNAYIVRLVEAPVVAYDGSISGYRATRPAKGSKINPNGADVVRYSSYLTSRHDATLAAAGGGRKLYSYRYTFNGFSAELTEAQAQKLRTVPGVIAVDKDVMVEMDTSTTPRFLGLDLPGGLWDQLGGKQSAGEDIIIGIVDSGIWPESLSFTDRTQNGVPSKDGKLSYQQIPGWHGKCTPGENFNASMCNQKLIGAQYFNAGQGGNAGINTDRPWEFNSVRDYNGHGTHTASTAGGNNGVPTTGPAAGLGKISGMAPRARIASYKALWSTESGDTATGSNSDLVAAIDQAVADGVDVINYSISGTTTNFADPVEIAFLFAADAGIFVAASAGNSGPTTGTVAHPGPWLTTVAAGTHNRNGTGSVTLGNGATYYGASLASAVGPAPLIDSMAAGLPGADPVALSLCFTAADNGGVPVLDPAKVAGKIVVCDRGINARVNKSLAVKQAGGIGMILVNVTSNSLNADFHFVPTVHLQNTDRAAVQAYAATATPTATINQSTITQTDPAPFTAAFSSRGPLAAGGGDLLKPDVIAPGQDILASVAPPANAGLDFNLYSGTSMSSPHVAGLAALLKDKYPTWSPMMIKSALMTSGYDVLDGPNTNPLVIFRQGAGHVRPNSAADPGLVFEHGFNDWLAFLCGTTTAVQPASCNALVGAGYSLDPSDLNVASVAFGDLAGVQTVKRKVTNVSPTSSSYTYSIAGLTGVDVSVSPASFTLGPGQSQTLTIAFARTTAALNVYAGGQITWTDGSHRVRVPVVVRPVALAAPVQVSDDYTVRFGYTGPFTATARGLIPATTTAGTVTDDPTDNYVKDGPGTVAIPVTIPAGTTYARLSLFNSAVTPGGQDLDLYLYNPAGTLIAGSGGGTSDEEINLLNPAAGIYTAYVHGFAVTGTANFTLFSWALGSAAAGNMTVTAPLAATLGQTGLIDLAFIGLTPGTKYLGSVVYGGIAGLPNPTIVRVDP